MTRGARSAPATAGRFTGWIAVGLLFIFVTLVSTSIGAHAPVYDEPVCMAEGYAAWSRERPPLASMLCALPLRFLRLRSSAAGPAAALSADRFLYRNMADPDTMLLLARLPNLIVGVLLGWLVYHWAARLGGGAAGILALTMYVFSPVMLDQAGLATNDLPTAAAVAAGLYAIRAGLDTRCRRLGRPAWRWPPLSVRFGAASAASAAALLGLLAFLSSRQIGVRMLLPAVPLLCVLAGQVVAGAASGKGAPTFPAGGRLRMLVVGLLASWIMVGTLRAGPHFHAEDRGQDLKSLGDWYEADQARRGPAEMILSYYGSGDPRYYGMLKTQALVPVGPPRNYRHVNSRAPRRERLVISATNLRDRFAWLRDGERPTAIIGRTIFVYDVTNRPDIHARLMRIYEATGCPAEAARERALARGKEGP